MNHGQGRHWLVGKTTTTTIETAVVLGAAPMMSRRRLLRAGYAVVASTLFFAMTNQSADAFAPSSSILSGLSLSSSTATTLKKLAAHTHRVTRTKDSENSVRPISWRVVGDEEKRSNEPLLYENYEASLFASDYDEDDDDLLDEDEMNLIAGALDTVQTLQQQDGPANAGRRRRRGPKNDVLSTQEQVLLDQSDAADSFLENFGGVDASRLEKIAMGSIPAQLPQAPLGAFLEKTTTSSSTSTRKRQRQSKHGGGGGGRDDNYSPMQNSRKRVSVEQELQLGRLIQAGAKVFRIKDSLQVSLGREPTKHEWAKAAGLDSPKELRRTVAAYRTAKHMLVTANMGLVDSMVAQTLRNRPRHDGVSHEELIQEGSLGLLRAAELFDPSRGLRFSTYAVVWIKGMLANTHVGELVRLPSRERTKWNKINEAAAALQVQDRSMSGIPSAEALSACTGLPLKDVADVMQRMTQLQSHHLVSLDAGKKFHDRSGAVGPSSQATSQYESISYDDEDLAEQAQLRADIIATLAKNLTPREARLMRLRYGLTDGQSRSIQECADAMGLPIKAVRILDKKCIKSLREAADAHALEELLLSIS